MDNSNHRAECSGDHASMLLASSAHLHKYIIHLIDPLIFLLTPLSLSE